MLRHLMNLSVAPLPAEEYINFMLRHLLNLSVAPLPAEEYINFMLRSHLICVNHLLV